MSKQHDKDTWVAMACIGMAGNIAQATMRAAMAAGRVVTIKELAFIETLEDKTQREISDYCYDLGISPAVAFL